MIPIRPALILGSTPSRSLNVAGFNNLVQSDDPATVQIVGAGLSTTLQTLSYQQWLTGAMVSHWNYARFAFPLTDPLFRIPNGLWERENISPKDGKTFDAQLSIYGMTVDWDHTTLCWNNKPDPLLDDPVLTKGVSYGISNTDGLLVNGKIGCPVMAFQCTGTIYGIFIKPEITSTAGNLRDEDYIELSQTTGITAIITQAQLTRAIVSRSSTGTTRTLNFAAAHGLVVGMPIKVTGVPDVTGTDYYNRSVGVATVPSSTSLTYSATGSLSESTTASGGTVTFW